MTRIIMVRHGQSLANAEHRFAGHSNFDLSPLGSEQAKLAAEYLFNIEKPDIIYSSDLLRAHNTALPFSKKYSLPINDTKELRELFAGSWEGLALRDIAEKYGEDLLRWRDDFSNSYCTDGESVAELYARIVPAVKRLAAQNDGKCVLMTSHATPIRAVEAEARGLGPNRIHEIPFVRNTAINIFEYDCSKDILTAVETNIVSHLGENLVTGVPTSLNN